MSFDRMLGDEIYIVSPSGEETVGPIKASVQGNKVYVFDESLVIEEGGRILRTLPNGRCESHFILQVDFSQAPPQMRQGSHYKILTRKDSSLVDPPSKTTINISHSHGIQIGDGNVQNIIASLHVLANAIDSADVPEEEKADAKQKLKSFLSHPLTTTVLGAAAAKLIGTL
jgi:hypothetical protein